MTLFVVLYSGERLLLPRPSQPREIWIKNEAKRSNNNNNKAERVFLFSGEEDSQDDAHRQFVGDRECYYFEATKRKLHGNSTVNVERNMISSPSRGESDGKLSRGEVLFLALFKIIKMNFLRR